MKVLQLYAKSEFVYDTVNVCLYVLGILFELYIYIYIRGLCNDSALTHKAIQVQQSYMQAANSGQTHGLFCSNHITEHVCSDSLLVCGKELRMVWKTNLNARTNTYGL